MKRWMILAALMAAAAGCHNGTETSLWQQLKTLREEKSELSLQVEQLRQDNTALTQQVETLAGLDADARAAGLVVPETLRIGRHTGFYDKTRDGQKESLIVYLEPLDDAHDVIKAAGRVEVELWNLEASPERARLGVWVIEAGELKGMWGRGLTGAYYRLTFPLDGEPADAAKELTLRVRFTDYLTGRVLVDQRVLMR